MSASLGLERLIKAGGAVLAVAAVTYFAAACAPTDNATTGDATPLELSELWSFPTPLDGALGGARVFDDSSVLLWSEDGEDVWLVSDMGTELLPTPVGTYSIGAHWDPDNRIVSLVTVDGTLLGISGDDVEVISDDFPSQWVPREAYLAEGTWFVSAVRGTEYVVFRAEPDGGWARFATRELSGGDAEGYWLSVSSAGVLIAGAHHPFEVSRVSLQAASEGWRSEAGPSVRESIDFKADRPVRWIGLGAVQAGESVIQTLVSAWTDQRLVVRYGRDGSVSRVSAFDVPISLLGSSPDLTLVLGNRNAGVTEYVVYQNGPVSGPHP